MEPKRLGPTLARWLRSSRSSGPARVYQAWEDRIDPSIRRRARPVDWKSGTLWVEVATSSLLHELSSFRRNEMVQILQDEGVMDIRFVQTGHRPG